MTGYHDKIILLSCSENRFEHHLLTIMSPLSRAEILNIAKLANLAVSEADLEALSSGMIAILAYMEEILALDVDGVPETTRMTEETNVWRADVVEASLSQAEALQNGKSVNGYFVVPPVLQPKKEHASRQVD